MMSGPLQPGTHSSSCLASSCRDCACFSASTTTDALPADLESSRTLSLSSCLAPFKATAKLSYSYFFFKLNNINLSSEHVCHFLKLPHKLCFSWEFIFSKSFLSYQLILSSDSGIDYNPSFVTILNIFLPMGTIFIRFMEFQCHPQGEALISEGLLMV